MNKELASKFLSSIKHEREQDIQTTSRLLTTLSIQQLVQNGFANPLTPWKLRILSPWQTIYGTGT